MTTWETEHANWLRRFAHQSWVCLLVPCDDHVTAGASDQVADERSFPGRPIPWGFPVLRSGPDILYGRIRAPRVLAK